MVKKRQKKKTGKKKKKHSEAFQKQNLFILILLLIVFAVILVLYFALDIPGKTKVEEDLNVAIFENKQILQLEIAKTHEQRTTGLMHRESLEENSGMLFIYGSEQQLTFWMKNTLIPLDMIFLNSNKTIVHIIKNAQPCVEEPCKVYPSENPAIYVIEVNAGYTDKHGILKGQKVEFDVG
jgi:uncharacterized membrane protein (UPF0127 family)